jgi:hypothetical protein
MVKRKLPIVTTYYGVGGDPVKTNRASRASRGIERAITHMQDNRYDARYVEVVNDDNGKHYLTVVRHFNGDVRIDHKEDIGADE